MGRDRLPRVLTSCITCKTLFEYLPSCGLPRRFCKRECWRTWFRKNMATTTQSPASRKKRKRSLARMREDRPWLGKLLSEKAKKQHKEAKARLSYGDISGTFGMLGKRHSLSAKRAQALGRKRLWKTKKYRDNWVASRTDPRQASRRYRNYSNAWKRPEVKRARLRTVWTSLEKITACILDGLTVQYVSQPHLGTASTPDFLLPAFRRVIECDGAHWHSSVLAKRTDRRNNARYRRRGYRVSRLSERLIKNKQRLTRHLIRVLGVACL